MGVVQKASASLLASTSLCWVELVLSGSQPSSLYSELPGLCFAWMLLRLQLWLVMVSSLHKRFHSRWWMSTLGPIPWPWRDVLFVLQRSITDARSKGSSLSTLFPAVKTLFLGCVCRVGEIRNKKEPLGAGVPSRSLLLPFLDWCHCNSHMMWRLWCDILVCFCAVLSALLGMHPLDWEGCTDMSLPGWA